jgi:hypothetical protein
MALALNCCTFCPGINTKRFARNMAALAEHDPEREITPKQAEYLRRAVLRFARQIEADVVALALMPEGMRAYQAQTNALERQAEVIEREQEEVRQGKLL